MCQEGQTLPNLSGMTADDKPTVVDSTQRHGWSLCTLGLGHCDVIMNVDKMTQAQTTLHLTVAYLLHCVAIC